ncbi:MAG TPA: hypothetical protein VFU02_08145, partial [Polyangiaceae bacterium]|nr:hypothetical protein [Polyangiaceae bacterium]
MSATNLSALARAKHENVARCGGTRISRAFRAVFRLKSYVSCAIDAGGTRLAMEGVNVFACSS